MKMHFFRAGVSIPRTQYVLLFSPFLGVYIVIESVPHRHMPQHMLTNLGNQPEIGGREGIFPSLIIIITVSSKQLGDVEGK